MPISVVPSHAFNLVYTYYFDGFTLVISWYLWNTWADHIMATLMVRWAQDLLGKRTFLPTPLKVYWPYKKLNIIYPRGSACHRNMSCNIKFFFSLENRHRIFLILNRWINQLNKRGTLRWNIFHLYYIIREINY